MSIEEFRLRSQIETTRNNHQMITQERKGESKIKK